jgi:hypothetical protein
MIPVAFWLGEREIQRVPLGRMELLASGVLDAERGLDDVRDAGDLRAAVKAWLAERSEGNAARVDALLSARRS